MRIPARLRDFALGATGGLFLAAMLGLAFPSATAPTADQPAESVETGGFAFTFERTVPGSPRDTYDALTGDISGWWDHTFSGNPQRLYIEPRPGGGFYELFNESGDGIRHAVVTAAERGVAPAVRGSAGPGRTRPVHGGHVRTGGGRARGHVHQPQGHRARRGRDGGRLGRNGRVGLASLHRRALRSVRGGRGKGRRLKPAG